MLNLLKYEFIRKRNLLLGYITLLMVAELVIGYLVHQENQTRMALGIASFFFVVSVSAVFVIYDNVKLLSDDLNKNSGYMLFMTSNNGYHIMGTKVIVGFLEVLIVSTILIGLGVINAKLMDSTWSITTSEAFIQMTKDSLIFDREYFGVGYWLYLVFSQGLGWFSFILTVYLAIVLRKTLFSNIKYKGFVSFIVFLVINFVWNALVQLILFSYFYFSGIVNRLETYGVENQPTEFINFIMNTVHISNALGVIFIVVSFLLCGRLLTRNVDL